MIHAKLLLDTESQAPLDLRAIEFSTHALRIFTSSKFDPDCRFRLIVGSSSVAMQIASRSLAPAMNIQDGYWIQPIDGSSIEGIIRDAGLVREGKMLPTMIVNKCILRSARFSVSEPMTVNVKTFGTSSVFKLSIVNLSRTGMLLHSESAGILPFLQNTILDLELDGRTAGSDERSPRNERIQCLAKVVRCVEAGSETNSRQTTGIAVTITDIEERQRHVWDSSVAYIETVLDKDQMPQKRHELAG
jgi:hypothetical protein